AGGKVATGCTDDDDPPAGHVLAAMIAHALDHGVDTGITDAETLTHDAAQIDLTGDGAIADDVAGNDVLLRLEARLDGLPRRVRHDPRAAQALAEVVIGVSFQFQGQSLGCEAAEALPGRAVELEVDGVIRQAIKAIALADLTTERGGD